MVSIFCSQTTIWKQVERYYVINYTGITSDRYGHPFHDTLVNSEVLGFYTMMCKMNQKKEKVYYHDTCYSAFQEWQPF